MLKEEKKIWNSFPERKLKFALEKTEGSFWMSNDTETFKSSFLMCVRTSRYAAIKKLLDDKLGGNSFPQDKWVVFVLFTSNFPVNLA